MDRARNFILRKERIEMKQVRAICHDILNDGRSQVGWSDVWIQFTTKPNRKIARYGLTLIGKKDLASDIYLDKQCIERAKTKDDLELVKEFEQSLTEQKNLLETLKYSKFAVDDIKNPYQTPSVYIYKDYFDKQDANQMIDYFMRQLGFRGAKVKWQRDKSKVRLIPITLNISKSVKEEKIDK